MSVSGQSGLLVVHCINIAKSEYHILFISYVYSDRIAS